MTRRIDNPDTDADIELRGYLDADARTCFVMVAGAGSGKTTSLVKALDYIGEKYGSELRRCRQQIACITYTEIAVGEIWGDVGNDPLFHVSTIHSFLWGLAKPFQKDIAAWVRHRIEAKLEELRQEKGNFGPRVQQRTREKNARNIAKCETQLEVIGKIRRFRYESGADYSEGILGHDDIIKMVPQLIQERPLLVSIVAQRYPFFFVDESQDTFPVVVDALRSVARQQADGEFCLGFFGDSMQQIYVHGAGEITREPNWKEITKPENFRCPTTVLSVINNIRSQGDGLRQTRGRQLLTDNVWLPVPGTAKLFVLPADEHRDQNLSRVRAWLANTHSDEYWTSDSEEADVRIMVIVHRMAATRLGYGQLFAAFNDDAPESFKDGFREGTAWPLRPFLDFLLPLCLAFEKNRQFEVMRLLRACCPRLDKEGLKAIVNPTELLNSLKESIQELAGLMSKTGGASILEVLRFANRVRLVGLDDRLREYVDPIPPDRSTSRPSSLPIEQEHDPDEDKTTHVMEAYLSCPARQLWGYYTYISDESPYSTQQGIKGAEFERVLVILDDEEGRHNQFSYDKLLGLKDLSNTDIDNQSQGKDTILDRTRRLFYVCCSRAKKDLAVVLYHADVENVVAKLKTARLFEPADIHTLDDIS